jgi:hypothetical protein
LFNLDGGGSVKTIHDRHKELNVPQGRPPRKDQGKEVVDMVQTPPPKKGKGNGKKGEVTDSTSETDRDSASQTSNSSSASEAEEKKEDNDDDSSSKEGSRFTTSNKEEDDQSMTGGG